jgi:hypothetical protein
VVVCTIDSKEGSYSIDGNRNMHLNAPSFVACLHPNKLSKVEEPDRAGGPCPDFVIQPLTGRPSIPCPYGILCRNTTNSRWNKSQWLKCHGCTALQNNLSLNVIWNDRQTLKVILSNVSALLKFVNILLPRFLFVIWSRALDKDRTKETQELVRKYYAADDDLEKISKEEYATTVEVLIKGTMNLRVVCLLFAIEQHTKTNEYHLSTSCAFPEKRILMPSAFKKSVARGMVQHSKYRGHLLNYKKALEFLDTSGFMSAKT